MNFSNRIMQMTTPVFIRVINLATGVQESEEVMDISSTRTAGTISGRIAWAVTNGRAVTVGPVKVPE